MNNNIFSLHTYKQKYDYTPLKIVFIFLNFTYLFHLFFSESPSVYGLIFMSVINISIIVGYILPNTSKIALATAQIGLNSVWKKEIKVNRIIILCSIIIILSSINTVKSFYPDSGEILTYLKNPGEAYMYIKHITNNPDIFDVSGWLGSTFSILLTLLSATKYIFFMFSILYWKQLKSSIRLLSISTTVIYIATSFLIGSMITIGTILMSCIPIFLINMKRKGMSFDFFKKRLKYFLIAGLGTFMVVYFMSNRVSDNNLLEGVKVLGFYISHGYVGLDYCLELPFEPTFGFTSFKGIFTMFVEYLGAPDLFQNSYLIRNELANNYPALSVWSTIFPWLASDFSFYFIPFIMLVISYQFSLIWNKTLRTGNPYGYLLLGQFFIFWFMVPANNQLFHTLGNSASFVLILFLYLKSKRYYKITKT